MYQELIVNYGDSYILYQSISALFPIIQQVLEVDGIGV